LQTKEAQSESFAKYAKILIACFVFFYDLILRILRETIN